ncbi:MAG TPA: hypothetical protein VGN42_15775 [Pirellulales bacterium]|nr:hypothetical protein [Pirellulales bacterium]
MNRDEVRLVLGAPHSSFTKGYLSKTEIDGFFEGSFHVFYDADACCEAIEIYGSNQVLFDGENLLAVPYSQAKRFVSSRDPDLEENDAGFTSHLFGVGVYAPSCVECPDDATESVIAFRKGCYDDMPTILENAKAIADEIVKRERNSAES